MISTTIAHNGTLQEPLYTLFFMFWTYLKVVLLLFIYYNYWEAKKLTINRWIKSVAMQMYKRKSKMAPTYLQELFSDREDLYNLSTNDTFHIPHFQTMTYGKKSFRYYGSKLWMHIPSKSEAKYHSVASNQLWLAGWILKIIQI